MCVSSRHPEREAQRRAGREAGGYCTKPGKYEVRFKAVEVFEDITHQLRKWFAGQDDAQDIAAESTTAAPVSDSGGADTGEGPVALLSAAGLAVLAAGTALTVRKKRK